jgi:hypothetical protein
MQQLPRALILAPPKWSQRIRKSRPSIVAWAKDRWRWFLTRGKLFMIASEKAAVPTKAIARTEIVLMVSILID